MRKRVLHVVPAMNIGGVEVGIHKSYNELNEKYIYQIYSMKGKGTVNVPLVTTLEFLASLLSRKTRPDIVVSSLWPGHALGYLLSLMGIPWIPFFHSAMSYGAFKDFSIRNAVKRGKVLLFDSKATRNFLGISSGDPRAHLCPYVFKTASPTPIDEFKKRPIDIIYVGRISSEKRLDLIKTYLTELKQTGIHFSLHLALAGSLSDFNAVCAQFTSAGMAFDAQLNLSQEEISKKLRDAKFYILMSNTEGFSMGTVEAVQCGCIPIVRPVGEIPSYLERHAAIWLDSPDPEGIKVSVGYLKKIWADWEALDLMRLAGAGKLRSIGYYVQEFSAAIDHRLNISP